MIFRTRMPEAGGLRPDSLENHHGRISRLQVRKNLKICYVANMNFSGYPLVNI